MTITESLNELFDNLSKLNKSLSEHASAGSTGAGSVATAVGGIGVGFDPSRDHGIYEKPKKKKIIRR